MRLRAGDRSPPVRCPLRDGEADDEAGKAWIVQVCLERGPGRAIGVWLDLPLRTAARRDRGTVFEGPSLGESCWSEAIGGFRLGYNAALPPSTAGATSGSQ